MCGIVGAMIFDQSDYQISSDYFKYCTKKNVSSEQITLIQERLSKKLTDFKLDVNIVESISKSASGKHSFLKSSAE